MWLGLRISSSGVTSSGWTRRSPRDPEIFSPHGSDDWPGQRIRVGARCRPRQDGEPPRILQEILSQTLEEMSEDSEKEDYSDRTISDEDESDEDMFTKFVSEDLHRRALLTADSFGDPFFPRTTQILLEYQLGRWVPRLREPRDLYGVSSSGPLSPTRWPYHCEVIDEKVQHIDWTPSCPEPVYIPTGLETEPLYPDSKEANVVYLAEDAIEKAILALPSQS
ncbi:cytosolic carboxypeptidase 3 isoform X12 [Symphalangus syndactylus]|uniref:cytosolic carboxypeptidase 3 isoform X12 n=1 Tax=Symphalangus syndactylus TaxID=9590 RepID=UPI002442F952|nr:cytosolic carboxypeptidase 3 isoform X12 [Symphalangus syndactylus]